MMHSLEQLKEMLMSELEEFARKGELSAGSLETINKLADTIKNLCKIQGYEEEGYSERSYAQRGGSYDGGSYARGSSYQRRDSMGRYSRDNSYARGGRGGRGGYSRDEEKETMREQIEELMESANNEKERQALQRAMNALQNA